MTEVYQKPYLDGLKQGIQFALEQAPGVDWCPSGLAKEVERLAALAPQYDGLIDCMEELIGKEFPVLDKGFIRLVDFMPRLVPKGQTPEYAAVQAARTSYGQGTKSVREDRGLFRYLVRNKHTSPLEMIEFKFHIRLPIFIMRQWVRHRMASLNEYSGRYSVMQEDAWVPSRDDVRGKNAVNKQGSGNLLPDEDADYIIQKFQDVNASAYATYLDFLERGLSNEISRGILPVNQYTECYWKMDLHNLLNFLRLRADRAHAQKQIVEMAEIIEQIVKKLCPVAYEAYVDYIKYEHTASFSRMDLLFIRDLLDRYERAVDNAKDALAEVNIKNVLAGEYEGDPFYNVAYGLVQNFDEAYENADNQILKRTGLSDSELKELVNGKLRRSIELQFRPKKA
jgi:thymidylate synthase (FAD)